MNLLRGWLAPRVGPAGRRPEVRPPCTDPAPFAVHKGVPFYVLADNHHWTGLPVSFPEPLVLSPVIV